MSFANKFAAKLDTTQKPQPTKPLKPDFKKPHRQSNPENKTTNLSSKLDQ